MKPQSRIYWLIPGIALVIAFLMYGLLSGLFFKVRAFGGGDGSVGDPYQITDCTDLQNISLDLTAHYILSTDIDCDGVSWNPIGTDTGSSAFSGVLDGNNKSISNISVTKGAAETGSYLGVFGTIEGGSIFDLTVVDVNIYAPKYEYVGGLVGEAGYGSGTSTLSNITISGSVNGYRNVGGLVGYLDGDTLSNITSSVTVSGGGTLGGIVGYSSTDILNSSSSGTINGGLSGNSLIDRNIGGLAGIAIQNITNCHSTSVIASGGKYTGGLVGYASGTGYSVSDSYASGNITVTGDTVGGLVGWNYADIVDSYSTGSLNVSGSAVGGLVGTANASITTSHATGQVVGNADCVGGLVGDGYSDIYQSYALGNVEGTYYIGGLAGENSGVVNNSFATGNVTASDSDAGGLVGDAMGNVVNSYSVGTVSCAGSYVGGLIGWTNASISSSYYNSETTSQTDTDRGTPMTTSELKTQSTFSGWDFSTIWSIVAGENSGYPINYTASSPASSIATISSSVYTITSGGTESEYIYGVEESTSYSTFMSNISKDDANATFDDSNLDDPVIYGNTLVVTAEDGTTSVTYTLMPPDYSGDGSGTELDPYKIDSCTELQEMQYYLDSHFILLHDVDCSATSLWNLGKGFAPIGSNPGTPFIGSLDGSNYTITGLTINQTLANGASFVGLFGDIDNGAEIKNLRLVNFDITLEGYMYAGALAGALGMGNTSGSGTIDNVKVIGGSISGGNYTGGLIGFALGGTGYVVSDCSSSAVVTGDSNVGGLIGGSFSKILNSSAEGNVSALNGYAGGLVGVAGGIIGQSFAKGNVSDGEAIGGFIGQNAGATITNSYARGDVTGSDYVGGFIGTGGGSVSNCYSTGFVTSSGSAGGFIASGPPPTSSYYDTDTSGQSNTGLGTPKTTEEMYLESTYVSWNFSEVWSINPDFNDGYPALEFAGEGDGTEELPYVITNCLQLQNMDHNLSAHYIIGNNIDCSETSTWNSGEGFLPVGNTSDGAFTGVLDGNDKNITNLVIQKASDYVGDNIGILGYVSGATIFDLYIGDITVDAVTSNNVGSLVGSSSSSGSSFSNIVIAGGSISGGGKTGGLIGYMNGIGDSLSSSYTNVQVSGTGGVGGLIGQNSTGNAVSQCHSFADITVSASAVGGLVGYNLGSISKSYALGNIDSGSLNTGGLVGLNSGNISESYALGNVVGQYYIGGLIGLNSGVVTNTYARGNVTGTDYVGGNLGRETSNTGISYSYAFGHVTATSGSHIGGLEGAYEGTGSILSSYYNSDNSGTSDTGRGTAMTSAEFLDKTNFSNWNFSNTWILLNIQLITSPSNGGTASLSGNLINAPFLRYETRSISGTTTTNSGFNFVNWTEGSSILSTNKTFTLDFADLLTDPEKNITANFVAVNNTTDSTNDSENTTNNSNDNTEETPTLPVDEEQTTPPDNDYEDDTSDTSTNAEDQTTKERSVVSLKVLAASIVNVGNHVIQFTKDIPIESSTTKNITEATLALITITPLVTAGLGSTEMFSVIYRLISGILIFFNLGKKKRNCGLVYNSVTKEPVSNAIVRFYDMNKELVATEVTSVYGIFETDLPHGEYSITVKSSGMLFPSNLILGEKDLPYENIYKGNTFNYNPDANLSFSIPVDPVDHTVGEYAKTIARNRVFNIISSLITISTIVGFVFSFITYIKEVNSLNLIILLVYILILILTLVISKNNKFRFGVIKYSSGVLAENFAIGLQENEFNTLYAKRITNEKGKYRFIVPKGSYKLVSLDPLYNIQVVGSSEFINRSDRPIAISPNIVITKKL